MIMDSHFGNISRPKRVIDGTRKGVQCTKSATLHVGMSELSCGGVQDLKRCLFTVLTL